MLHPDSTAPALLLSSLGTEKHAKPPLASDYLKPESALSEARNLYYLQFPYHVEPFHILHFIQCKFNFPEAVRLWLEHPGIALLPFPFPFSTFSTFFYFVLLLVSYCFTQMRLANGNSTVVMSIFSVRPFVFPFGSSANLRLKGSPSELNSPGLHFNFR
jgi:hypothetical protein